MSTGERGRTIELSVPRRIMTDLMRFAAAVPTVPALRRMNVSAVMAARRVSPLNQSWSAIFAKAYALVARERPELRRIFFSFPRERCVEFPQSTASVAIEINYNGEPAVFPCVIGDPASLSLVEISERIRMAVEAPEQHIANFQRYVALSSLPWVIRRWGLSAMFNMPDYRATHMGTFALTAVANLGTDLIHPLSAWPTLLTYGVFSPDGTTDVRIIFDHRVLDGCTVARALARLEEVLNGPIIEELQGDGSAAQVHARAVSAI